jgi:hypothetical protein
MRWLCEEYSLEHKTLSRILHLSIYISCFITNNDCRFIFIGCVMVWTSI